MQLTLVLSQNPSKAGDVFIADCLWAHHFYMLELAQSCIEFWVGTHVYSYCPALLIRNLGCVQGLCQKPVPVIVIIDFEGDVFNLCTGNPRDSYYVIKIMGEVNVVHPRSVAHGESGHINLFVEDSVYSQVLYYTGSAIPVDEVIVPSEEEPSAVVLLEEIRLEEEPCFFIISCLICYSDCPAMPDVVEIGAQLVEACELLVTLNGEDLTRAAI